MRKIILIVTCRVAAYTSIAQQHASNDVAYVIIEDTDPFLRASIIEHAPALVALDGMIEMKRRTHLRHEVRLVKRWMKFVTLAVQPMQSYTLESKVATFALLPTYLKAAS